MYFELIIRFNMFVLIAKNVVLFKCIKCVYKIINWDFWYRCKNFFFDCNLKPKYKNKTLKSLPKVRFYSCEWGISGIPTLQNFIDKKTLNENDILF